MKIIFFVLLASVFSLNLAYAQNNADALVQSIKGKALVKDEKNAKPRTLNIKEKLMSGQWVSCPIPACQELIITQCKFASRVPNNTNKNIKWKQILSVNCSSLTGVRGGAPKAGDGSVISPKESQTIRPEPFSLRWKPYKYPIKIKLLIRIYLGEDIIWSQEDIDVRKGFYKSDSLEKALKDAQRAGKLHVVLELDDGSTTKQKTRFAIISFEDEQSLIKDLEALENETDEILKAVGRGTVFSKYELYEETVNEFEQVLKQAQKQKAPLKTLNELRKLAIMANYQAYNEGRVKQLCNSLKLPHSIKPCACSQSCR